MSVKPHVDLENIETYHDSQIPWEPNNFEARCVTVYFPVDTTDEEIKEALKPIMGEDDEGL